MFVLYLYSIHDLSFYPAIECLSDWTFKSCCYWWTKSHISFRTTHQPQNMMQTRMDGTSQLCLKNVAHILNFDKSLLIVVILGKLPWTKTWNFWRHRRFRPFRPAATVGTTVLGAVGASAVIRLWPGCSGWKAAPQTKEPKSKKIPTMHPLQCLIMSFLIPWAHDMNWSPSQKCSCSLSLFDEVFVFLAHEWPCVSPPRPGPMTQRPPPWMVCRPCNACSIRGSQRDPTRFPINTNHFIPFQLDLEKWSTGND